ncbi:transposase family protein [Actinosynnema sp. CS-041913]|uniref:transposase family protein n=1 Tax=Actinosynnema sp. CS-041913 TaxID=3239917 RepID=UPI003D9491F8
MDRVDRSGASITLHAKPTAGTASCPQCGTESARVHSHYRRKVADLATAGQEVLLYLEVRRFFCTNGGCGRRIFGEQVDGLTVRYGRRSVQLRDVLRRIAPSTQSRSVSSTGQRQHPGHPPPPGVQGEPGSTRSSRAHQASAIPAGSRSSTPQRLNAPRTPPTHDLHPTHHGSPINVRISA